MAKRALITCLLIAEITTAVSGCGMSVHNEVTVRALSSFSPAITEYEKYSNFIREYPTFVQTGSFFPDWGYDCLENPEQSEAAHWPEFLRAGVNYIRERYPIPWTDEQTAQSIIAFLFAITSHDVADVSWHSLRMRNGFIRVMADINFGGDYAKAHTVADNGGEFTLSHMSKLDYLLDIWEAPLSDIKEIYAKMGLQARPEEMSYCIQKAFTAQQANKRLGKHFFAVYGQQSPFLIEQFTSYYRGGLNEMAANTHECWYALAKWLEEGANEFFPCRVFAQYSTIDQAERRRLSEKARARKDDENEQTDTHTSDDEYIDFGKIMRTDAAEMLDVIGLRVKSSMDERGVARFYLEDRRNRTTDEITDITEDELEKIHTIIRRAIIGNKSHSNSRDQRPLSLSVQTSPFQTSVSVSPESPSNTTGLPAICYPVKEARKTSITLDISQPYASLGHAMCVGDFNNDGFKDLVLTAPYYTSQSSAALHIGRVFILDGETSQLRRSNVHTTADVAALANHTLTNPEQSAQARFGWSCAVVDLNGDGVDDLVISAPGAGNATDWSEEPEHTYHPPPPDIYSGRIYVYFGHAGSGLSTTPNITIQPGDARVSLGLKIEQLGQALVAGDIDGDGKKDLIIGCPFCSLRIRGVTEQVGAVFFILSSRNHSGILPLSEADHVLLSPLKRKRELFGSVIELVNHADSAKATLIVSARGYGNNRIPMAGKLYGYEITTREKQGDQMLPMPELVIRKTFDLSGTEKFQGLGSAILAGDFRGDGKMLLAVSSGSETHQLAFPPRLKFWQAGALRIIDFTALRNDSLVSDLRLGEGMYALLYGSESASHFGSAVHANGKGTIWVSEPFALWESGKIYKYSFNQNTGLLIPGAEECLTTSENRSKFGSKMVEIDVDGDGVDDFIIAAVHSSKNVR
ncbi:6545_t:CDS:10 [Paraglomus occultum]|uniref:Phosphatidylinositol-glycan-specific phospholipase D n=1 Tax=Paraglomus occultum TaxID=144539 RepID=A0A9N8VHF3_9GLOM|nr:6545_t:CDS:10 [Paraglomus occultum]